MRRGLRIGRTVGFVLSALVVAVWVASLCAGWFIRFDSCQMGVAYGQLGLTVVEGARSDWSPWLAGNWGEAGFQMHEVRLSGVWGQTMAEHARALGLTWIDLQQNGPMPMTGKNVRIHNVSIPLWLALAVVLAPTLLIHARLPRRRAGCCLGCGYDLTGNVSGRCPECGASFERPPGAMMG